MLARTHAFAIDGLDMRPVTVEVDVRAGLPDFRVTGLADARVREARDRVRAAIANAGFEFPMRRIVANLAPADVPKGGSALDLALACALLAASGQLAPEPLERVALFGELALDGGTRCCSGALAAAQAAARQGLRRIVLAPGSAREAMLVEGVEVAAAASLGSAARILEGGDPDAIPRPREPAGAEPEYGLDLADVLGQHEAVRALVIAAAGAHNLLMCGPPGLGKTMLAQRLPSILPPLGVAEALDVARIKSVTGDGAIERLERTRPFRAPHHTVTTAGLIGGAGKGWVGEIVLAHNGVLFLDELGEFDGQTLDALRQPMEAGEVAIARAGHSATYPARFMLVAATNPCRCGHGPGNGGCRCSPRELARYRRRLSGPLVDRIDLFPQIAPPGESNGNGAPGALMSSARARDLVAAARERQAHRLRDEHVAVNARMEGAVLARHARLDERAEGMMLAASGHGLLSVRAQHRAVRVARTIADLNGSERVSADHLQRALALRPTADSLAGERA